ncbi:hypothetical protein U1Q18_036581 [Sarracenia purpurea var. burkii]
MTRCEKVRKCVRLVFPRMNKMQGKRGLMPRSSANRYQVLISPEHDDYEKCFPVLSGAKGANVNRSRASMREMIPPGLCERDFEEEGRQLEKIAVRALYQAKQGSKPLSKGDVAYFETWLAKYRATSPQSIPLVAKTSKAVTTGKEVIFVEGIEEIKEYGVNIDIGDKIDAFDYPSSGREPDGESGPFNPKALSVAPTDLPKDILEIKEEDVSVTEEVCEGTDKELDSEEDENVSSVKDKHEAAGALSPLNRVCLETDSIVSKSVISSGKVLNLGVGKDKGDWSSGKTIPKVAFCGVRVDAHNVLDVMPQQKIVKKALTVSLSKTDFGKMDHDVISSTASCSLDVSVQEDFPENTPQPCSDAPEQGYCDPKIVEESFCKGEKNEGPLVQEEGSVSGIGISEAVGKSIEEVSPKSVKGIPVAVSGVKSCDPCMENGRKKQVEVFVNQIDDAGKVFEQMPKPFSNVQFARIGGPQSWADIFNKKKGGDPTS